MTFPARLSLPLVAGALLLLGCGGKSTTKDDGNDSGTASSAGTSSGGSASSSGASTSSGGATSGGSPTQCDFPDETGWTVTVRLTNGSKRPLYFGLRTPGCGLGSLFEVTEASGGTLQEPGFCSSSCQDLAHGSPISCPPIPCIVSTVVTLQPGESVIQDWGGAYLEQETLPPACQLLGDVPDCTRVVAVKPGAFTFTGFAASTIDCSSFVNPCPACMPDNNGGCVTHGAIVAGPEHSASTTVMLDASYGVGPSSQQPRPVEIVFKE